MSATCECKCKVCGVMFTARVADRKRGWAKCCGKRCAAIKRERSTGTYRSNMARIAAGRAREAYGADTGEGYFADAHLFSNEEHDCNKG
ncbi:hypothetical protein E5S69_11745 [Cupriavidus necator]|uniref:hypothetical protein n=1 Tax=Cupriavidus necator TaxID=106590 RepID=UPI00148FC65D|nr:hypothetical protein [Cupriavidus necator]NOV24185.1 hypothetical protein [Cupriavidus necator]